ncbi:helix-turn-helix transcriptional regulator [Yersinia enterocolitica]|uniref:helix-turn-helix domain-containing protein n=1 Tax=Yersinia TaxID=629 RepID=UPI001C60A863|nr:helix-turn-helix transcriptional regulator [Yersinia kristensenii]EKN3970327.1 helix-turn-helix transcriptional regulator [Yersinia enterocolitica]EKN4025680.1 helix-turn-helix transcriptional regulator [Yersinia enterocolitica]EKN4769339.1 helix-turn-helix transcriptional regulator [Yersinia enterocolitica]EKN5146695.1 XRE family transcriptional regulator [Yersinia enterocolitica]EKN5955831.1 XRE family transcriptional regulator [Yersinia enterocolitica]
MHAGKKIRAIRESEGLTREEFSGLLDIPIGTMRRYETGRIENIGGEVLFKITNHPRFKKYTMWLMTGDTNEDYGQVSPALSPDGQETILKVRSKLKTG